MARRNAREPRARARARARMWVGARCKRGTARHGDQQRVRMRRPGVYGTKKATRKAEEGLPRSDGLSLALSAHAETEGGRGDLLARQRDSGRILRASTTGNSSGQRAQHGSRELGGGGPKVLRKCITGPS
ncbi:44b6630c-62f2-4dc9-8e95-fb764c1aee20 [Thermothielavioides terrestris]|nr:44b6630c-62f2-4dc9-8e95-fb764c1aee20 [Thermothielavioides terrestris]